MSNERSHAQRDAWPELPWRVWGDTVTTLHLWTQIVGKVRMTLSPPLNHWWHSTLYVTPRGLTTWSIPYGPRHFQVDFDFLDHRVLARESEGHSRVILLEPKSVATFHREFMDALGSLGIEVRIHARPNEVLEAIPFAEDEVHRSYDPAHAHALWAGMAQANRILAEFRARFIGKASPVHFFWGGFDLATTRFSGRRAPLHGGAAPNCPPYVMEEAYSHEVSSAGWWPASADPGPMFYSYMYPDPPGFPEARVRPDGASFDRELGEFTLPYEDVRTAPDPDRMLREFLQSTYAAGADLAGWNRAALEPATYPSERPPRRAWSTTAAGEPTPETHSTALGAGGPVDHGYRPRRRTTS